MGAAQNGAREGRTGQCDKEVALAVLPLSLHVPSDRSLRSPSSPRSSSQSQARPVIGQVIWTLAPGATVGMALNSATQRLKEAEIETAFLDAQVILAHLLGVDRPWLFAHAEAELTAAQAEAYTEQVARRVRHEPVAYLVGRKEFYGLDLAVDRRVLIPRPETEMLVDEVLREIEARPEPTVRVADVGTGSGAIALAIAANEPRARILATDVSRDALAVAQENLARHDVRGQVTLHHGDLLAPLPEPVEIIVANLPYIAAAAYRELDATVRDYEPRLALESGAEGLDVIERLLRQAPGHLTPDGKLYLEIGQDQGAAVELLARTLLPQARDVAVHEDYQGHDRMVAIAL
jgi:release factor glutamine methyltransferase